MSEEFVCKHCDKSFVRESTYFNHMCKYKQRWDERNTTVFNIAVIAYQTFYDMEMNSKKKTMEDFIKSQFYNDFIKFARFCVQYDIPFVHSYLVYCIRNKVKIKKWSSPFTYDEFLYEHFLTKETPEEAIERSIKEIRKWAERTGYNENQFFVEAELNEAAWMIRTGRVSPWMVYIATSGKKLLDDLTEQHTKELGNVLNPNFWHKKFITNSSSVEFISNLLEQHGY